MRDLLDVFRQNEQAWRWGGELWGPEDDCPTGEEENEFFFQTEGSEEGGETDGTE